jgi:hypothetical protein
VNFICLVQQGAAAGPVRTRLEAGLTQLAAQQFPGSGEACSFVWMEVAAGCGFTAGQPTTAAIAAATVPTGTNNEVRSRFLGGLCDLWVRETGCSVDDILATAFDEDRLP